MTDRPRKIVVCHPDRYRDAQEAVQKLGHKDVLVQPNRLVPEDKMYFIDGDAMARLIDGEAHDA